MAAEIQDFKKRLLKLAEKLDQKAMKLDKAGDTAKADHCRELSSYLRDFVKEWK